VDSRPVSSTGQALRGNDGGVAHGCPPPRSRLPHKGSGEQGAVLELLGPDVEFTLVLGIERDVHGAGVGAGLLRVFGAGDDHDSGMPQQPGQRHLRRVAVLSVGHFDQRLDDRARGLIALIAKPGRPISEIVQHYRAQVAGNGAYFDHFAYGVRGLGIATESNHVLTEDDFLYVDFGCIYKYCFSDTGTTLAMREPSASILERHAALRACTRAGVEVIQPGVKTSEVQAAMWQTLNANGVTASFPHGHGLGLEVRDYPIIVADNGQRIKDDCVDVPSDLPLESDMVINLEAMISIPGVGTLHIEQSFVVTADGCRPLVPQYRERPILPNTA